jgi:hypothetical protein
MQRIRVWGAALVVAAALVGCGGGTAGVSGVVTLDGQPLEGATVSFTPASGDGGGIGGSYGKTDAQGRYTLKTVNGDRAGAAIGKHKVTISQAKADPTNPEGIAKDIVPAKYNTKSDLTFDVPSGGTDNADFALKSK